MSYTKRKAESDQYNQVAVVRELGQYHIILWFVKQIRIWLYTTNVSEQVWGRTPVFTDTASKWNEIELLCT